MHNISVLATKPRASVHKWTLDFDYVVLQQPITLAPGYHLTDIQVPGQLEKWLFSIEKYFKQNLNPKWDLKFTSELMEMWIRSKTRSNWSNSLKFSLIFFSLLIKKGIIFSYQCMAFGLGILYNSRNHLNKLVRKYTLQAILFFLAHGETIWLSELGVG